MPRTLTSVPRELLMGRLGDGVSPLSISSLTRLTPSNSDGAALKEEANSREDRINMSFRDARHKD